MDLDNPSGNRLIAVSDRDVLEFQLKRGRLV
jgi:hypothetical protein